jgi:two-component system LytT family sensor kinase
MIIKSQRLIPKLIGFWQFQVIGWSFMVLQDFIRLEPVNRIDIPIIAHILCVHITGLFFSSLLRLFYQRIYKKANSFIPLLIYSLPCSVIIALIWEITRDYEALLCGIDLNVTLFKFLDRTVTESQFLGQWSMMVWPFFLWSILYFGIKNWIDLINERENLNKITIHAKEAQLQMLRYQINPHFLFNSLNSIKALIYENPTQAGYMLTEFSEFLRTTLLFKDKIYIPVSEEIDILEKYLSIEKIRFEERLDYKITYDKDLLNNEILCLITQPLVENAIRHGLTNNPAGLKLDINFSVHKELMVIEIENSGSLNKNGASNGTGINNVIDRLKTAYQDQYDFSIIEKDNFVKVKLLIPVKL